MTESKISLEDSMKMSLDEIISATGVKEVRIKSTNRRRKRNGNNQTLESMDCDESMPNASSLQWRLKDPNRPVGMPPLIPSSARQKRHLGFYGNRRYFNKPYADRDKPSDRKNRNNQPFKTNTRESSIQAGLRYAANPKGLCTAMMPFQNNTIATIDQIAESVVGVVSPLIASSTYSNLINKVMEKWEKKRSQNMQKYDMSVQKEISQIQGKTLHFTCTSGRAKAVVSNDGDGIDDCRVKPVTTDTSMHQRFA